MPVHAASALPWQTYRDVRLRSLAADPNAFGSSFERESQFSASTWQQRSANPGTLLWVADDEPAASDAVAPRADGLAGVIPAAVYLDDVRSLAPITDDPQTLAFVVQVWVEPGRRGSGVFDDLMTRLVEVARDQGYRTLALHVFAANERARAAYVRHGFVKTLTPSAECPPEEDEYVLTL